MTNFAQIQYVGICRSYLSLDYLRSGCVVILLLLIVSLIGLFGPIHFGGSQHKEMGVPLLQCVFKTELSISCLKKADIPQILHVTYVFNLVF